MKAKKRILAAIEKLPARYYLRIGQEVEDDVSGERRYFNCAALMEEPPYDQSVANDRVHAAISCEPGDKRFWDLLAGMLEKRTK